MTLIQNPTMACIAIAGVATLAWMGVVSLFGMINTFLQEPIVSKWEDRSFEQGLSSENQAWMFFENLRNLVLAVVVRILKLTQSIRFSSFL